MAQKYVRFIVNAVDEVTGHPCSFFRSVYELRRSGKLTNAHSDIFSEILDWLDNNLDVPDRFARSSNLRAHGKAVSWFKPEAVSHINKSRMLLAIMEEYAVSSEMLTTDRPEYNIFEDEFQIAAISFRDG